MMKKFDREDIDLLFTDTDSLCYHIRNKDPFPVMKEHSSEFDLANYKKSGVKVEVNGEQVEMFDPINDKVLSKMKNESVSQITEMVLLRSKLYAYRTDDNEEHKKCKGVKGCVVEKDIKFQDYHDTNFKKENFDVKQNTFRSYKHQLYTITTEKTALSYCDDKTFVCDNMENCLSIGHYKTPYGEKLQAEYENNEYIFI